MTKSKKFLIFFFDNLIILNFKCLEIKLQSVVRLKSRYLSDTKIWVFIQHFLSPLSQKCNFVRSGWCVNPNSRLQLCTNGITITSILHLLC